MASNSITLYTDPTQESTPLHVDRAVELIYNRSGKYTRDIIKMIVQEVNHWCKTYLISPRVVMAQILHETGWFKYGGDVQWWQFNFAGLGATGGIIGNSFTQWVSVMKSRLLLPSTKSSEAKFWNIPIADIDVPASVSRGVLAVVQHHAVYNYGTFESWPHQVKHIEIVDPRYQAVIDAKYAGSILQVQNYGGKWAVPGVGYSQKIVEICALLPTQEEVPVTPPILRPYVMSIPLRVSHIPWGNPNRPGTKSLASGRGYITVHETGNTKAGANAEMHRVFTHNGGGSSNVSFTYVVDDKEAIELLPRGEKSWQASDGANGPGNSSVSIETCVNVDGNWSKTLNNLVELLTFLITNDPNLSVDRIVQHNHWAPDGKNCPTIMRSNGGAGWGHLLAKVRIMVDKQREPEKPARDPNALEVNGFWVIEEILHRWEGLKDNTLPLVGYPISRMDMFMIDGVERKAQIFERGILAIYEEGTPDGVPKGHPFRVRMLTLQEQDEVVAQAIEDGIIEPFE